jgi:hypothetical protein
MTSDATTGWCLIETDSGHIELQRDDAERRFATDEDALDYVVNTPAAARACIRELLRLCNDD